MSPKYLIVNADDYNTNPERDRGIIQAAQEGIVTSVSVIANMPSADDVLSDLQKTMGTRIGIHLNLTRGMPLERGVRTLVNQSGCFFDKQIAWRKAFLGVFDLREVEEEFAKQISLLKEMGITPDHIDGNNHIHVFPGIAQVVARLANQFGISRIRLPLESFSKFGQYFQSPVLKKYFIGTLSRRALPVFKQHSLVFTDHFAGIQFPVVSRVESVTSFIENLPDGTTELMCHPGYRSLTDSPFSSAQREQELFSLTHPAVLESVERFNISLISYSEMWS